MRLLITCCSGLESPTEVVVEWEGPASLGQEVHLTFAQPVKTRYLFIQVRISSVHPAAMLHLSPCRPVQQRQVGLQ